MEQVDFLEKELRECFPCFERIDYICLRDLSELFVIAEEDLDTVLYSAQFSCFSEDLVEKAKKIIVDNGFRIENVAWGSNEFIIYFTTPKAKDKQIKNEGV